MESMTDRRVDKENYFVIVSEMEETLSDLVAASSRSTSSLNLKLDVRLFHTDSFVSCVMSFSFVFPIIKIPRRTHIMCECGSLARQRAGRSNKRAKYTVVWRPTV